MTEPQVPGLKAGSRTEFLVIGDVIPGHEDALRQVMREHMANTDAAEPLQHPALKPLADLAADST